MKPSLFRYNLLTNLNVATTDGMPQFTCRSCLDTVNLFIEFREKSLSSETTLREMLYSDVKSEDGQSVKYEEESIENVKGAVNEDTSLKKRIKDESKIDDTISDFKDELKSEETVSDSGYELYADYEEVDYLLLNEVQDLRPRKCKRKLKINKKLETKVKLKCSPTALKEEVDEKLYCGICIKTLDNNGELEKHLQGHKNDKKCQHCAEIFDGWPQLLAHRLMHVPTKQKRCHLCMKRYVSCDYLEYHYRNLHVGEEGTKLRCKQCYSLYDSPRKLKKHIWAMHGEKKYVCDHCSKRYQSKSSLRSHVVTHTGNKAYVCDICGFRSKFIGGLKDHKIRKHTATKVYCKSCHRPFKNQQDHDKHKCDEKTVMCPVCGIQFSRSMKLSRHMNTHSDIPKYECDRCPSKFKTKYALKAHNDRHDGNRTNHCEYCPAKFYTGSSLIKHRRIHTGEKPYVCKICNKGFTANHNLKVHMKVHGEYNLINKKNKELDAGEVISIC